LYYGVVLLYIYTHKFVAINIKLRKSVNVDDLLFCMYDIPKPFIARNNILSVPSLQNVLFLSHFDFRFRIVIATVLWKFIIRYFISFRLGIKYIGT